MFVIILDNEIGHWGECEVITDNFCNLRITGKIAIGRWGYGLAEREGCEGGLNGDAHLD